MKPHALVQSFEQLFGQSPRIFRAPGRVNLIGEHTDYNDGFVLPAAIGFSTYVAIAARSDRKLVIRSLEFPGDFEFDLDHLPQQRSRSWSDYVAGMALLLRNGNLDLRGADLLLHGEVPIGAGLSSSAALEVACAMALTRLSNLQLALAEIARLGQRVENEFVGARVGIMDQFVSCVGRAGHAVLLDCRSLEFQLVPIPRGVRLVVCNTMVKHDHATSGYNQRREACEEGVRFFSKRDPKVRALRDVSVELLEQYGNELPPTILKRCTHVVRENQRTLDAARALTAGDLTTVSRLMHESHASMRDLYEISCRELDIMVDAAQDLPGFIGGRMTGGGFGGCTVNLVRDGDANNFAAQITERYHRATGIQPQTYPCSAEDGAAEIN